jgi:hypothetical protein
MPLSKDAIRRIRQLLNPAVVNEVDSLLKGRERWKMSRNTFEALSKVVSSFATMLAFAASAVKDESVTHWISFSSGCFGTMSMVMLMFAGYSGKTSRARTKELNDLLQYANITPMPQPDKGAGGDEEMGTATLEGDTETLHPVAMDRRLSMDTMRESMEKMQRAEAVKQKEGRRRHKSPDPSPS